MRESAAATPDHPELIARISGAIDARRDEIITFLRDLVRIPSPTGQEGAAQGFVAARMRADGLEPDIWEPDPVQLAPYAEHITMPESFAGRPNVVGTRRGAGGEAGRSLILNGHIDTVEPGEAAAWTVAPFGGDVIDGRVYGRGACDMKAGVAANLFALTALRDAGLAPRGDVVIQSTISEEDGGAGALSAVLRGYRADGAVISEPTQLAVIPAQGGSLMFRLRVPGRAAHAAVRDEGVSAIEKFAILHRVLLDFEAKRNASIRDPLYAPIANKIPINIGVVRAGEWPSTVPEMLVAEGRAGLVPGETLDHFWDELRAEVDRAAGADPWLRDHPPIIERTEGQFAPAAIPVESALVRQLSAAHAAITGAPPAVEAVTFGADMRHFILTGNTPCVMYGAGDARLAHRADESIAIAEVITATKVLALMIATWCGVVETGGSTPAH